jgi:mono/diheme cytochrome c family protein
LLLSGLTFGAISGCSDSYPEDLKYAPRTDPLCMEGRGNNKAGVDPQGIDSPGPRGWADTLISYEKLNEGKTKLLDARKLPSGLRSDLDKLLLEYFGTPAKPIVKNGDTDENKPLKLDSATLAKGSQHYRRQCMHCHGVSGDGRGPTGYWVNPHPRDYRQGVFKFISSKLEMVGRKAARADLIRVMRQGIDGTAMPAFGLLSNDELEELASYVIHLSMRGEMEFGVMEAALQDDPMPKSGSEFKVSNLTIDATGLKDYFEAKQAQLFDQWLQSQEVMSIKLTYDDYLRERRKPATQSDDDAHAQAVVRGFTSFQINGCLGCHWDYGRKRNYKWEVWGTVARPADLTINIYRGGRRPIDFYYRFRGGIDSCGMARVSEAVVPDEEKQGKSPDEIQKLVDQRIWDLVEFTIAAPYPAMLERAGIKEKIYAGE